MPEIRTRFVPVGAIWRYRFPARNGARYPPFSRKVVPMTSSHHPGFEIRRNADGSLDAICLTCFVTAGTAMSESELPTIERAHQCDIYLLAERQQWLLLPNR
jgi:hypothetical protein